MANEFVARNGIISKGGFTTPHKIVSTGYQITADDYLIECSGSFTVTLPTAVGIEGKHYIIKNNGSLIITIATTLSQTIDGVTSVTLAAHSSIQLISTGANWINVLIGDSNTLDGLDSTSFALTTSLNGTQNYLTKYGATGITQSLVYDNGTNVGIGTTTPNNLIQVAGLINFDNILSNTWLGYLSGNSNITGSQNTAIGTNALISNTTGSFNVAIGVQALQSNNGSENLALGRLALAANTSGGYNSAFGNTALAAVTTGSHNIGFGKDAGRYITGGSTYNLTPNNSIYIGDYTKALADNQTNQIVIGYNLTGIGSNTLNIANTIYATGTNGGNGGNVGIGTTTPNAKLDVVDGVIKQSGTVSDFNSFNKELRIDVGGGTNNGLYLNGDMRFGPDYGGARTGLFKYSTVLDSLIIDTWGSAKPVRIGGSTVILGVGEGGVLGNVGIGTTTPSTKLQVIGDTRIGKAWTNSNLEINGNIIFKIDEAPLSGIARNWSDSINGGITLQYSVAGVLNNGLVLNNQGNVGIGTTTPGTTLEVVKATQDLSQNTSGDAQVNLALISSDDMAADKGGAIGFGGKYITGNTNNILYAAITGRKLNSYSADAEGYLGFNVWYSDGLKERLRITNIGNVGIGTTEPLEKLQVAGNIYLPINNSGAIKFSNLAYPNSYASIQGINTSGGTDQTELVFNTAYGAVRERMRITTQGNVGIGTTTPSEKLHIQNSSVGAGDIFMRISKAYDSSAVNRKSGIILGTNAGDYGNSWKIVSESDSGYMGNANLFFKWNAGGIDSTKMTIGSTGNVGIGTSNPNAKLEVNGITKIFEASGSVASPTSGSLIIQHGNAGGASSITFPSAVNLGSDYGYIQYQDSSVVSGGGESAKLIIGTSNDSDDDIILMPSGNVGIGTTNPLRRLVVSGPDNGNAQLRLMGTSDINRWWDVGRESASTGRFKIAEYDNGAETERLTILMGGNVGIGTTTPAAKLHIVTTVNTQYNSLQIENKHGDYQGIKYKVTGGSGDYIDHNVLFEDNRPDTVGYVGSFFTIYRSSALSKGNILQVGSTTDASALTVKYNDFVGIGQTNPLVKLTVQSNVNTILALNRSDSTNVDDGPEILFNGFDNNRAFGKIGSYLTTASLGNNAYLAFSTRDNEVLSEKMRILSNGNVGIKTINPRNDLEIRGKMMVSTQDIGFSGTGLLNIYDANAPSICFFDNSNQSWIKGIYGGNLAFYTSGENERMRINSYGNVGIGTPTPYAKLHTKGTMMVGSGPQDSFLGGSFQIQEGYGVDTSISLWQNGAASSLIGHKAADANLYLTNTTQGGSLGYLGYSLVIKPSGNIGVGIDPSEKFEVAGTAKVQDIKVEDSVKFVDTTTEKAGMRYNTTNKTIEFYFN